MDARAKPLPLPESERGFVRWSLVFWRGSAHHERELMRKGGWRECNETHFAPPYIHHSGRKIMLQGLGVVAVNKIRWRRGGVELPAPQVPWESMTCVDESTPPT